MEYSFIVIGDQRVQGVCLEEMATYFPKYSCAGIFPDDMKSIENILLIKPQLIFFNTGNAHLSTAISFTVWAEMFEYLSFSTYLIVLSEQRELAFEAVQGGAADYLSDVQLHTLGKSLARFEKRTPLQFQQRICIKSYSDYQFLKYHDIVYLKADNNTTDFKLTNGNIVVVYKTLKHFELTLPHYFVRIHKSYIVNIHYVSRIQFSKSKCHLNFDEQLPFSSSYRTAVDRILSQNIIDS